MNHQLSLRSPAFWITAFTLLAGAAGLQATMRTLGFYLTKKPIYAVDARGDKVGMLGLPSKLPSWEQARPDEVLSKESIEELGTDNYISRWYRRVGGPADQPPLTMELHCAYYTGTIDTVPHVPERCLVGGGLELAGGSQLIPVPIDMSRLTRDPDVDTAKHGVLYTARSPITHTRYRLPRGVDDLKINVTQFRNQAGTQKLFAGYFFIANGGIVPTADEVRLLAFKLEDDYSYYLKVQFSSAMVGSAEELAEAAGSLLDEMWAELAQRVPDWVAVKEGTYAGLSARIDGGTPPG